MKGAEAADHAGDVGTLAGGVMAEYRRDMQQGKPADQQIAELV
ncbi:hypothetical protein [endosymbiont of Riftia pachyptila]|nr:hypothetical protein [endosymbiont of Riftia pachyptila]